MKPRVALPDPDAIADRRTPDGKKVRGIKVTVKRAMEIANHEGHNPLIPGETRTRDRPRYKMGAPERVFEPELAEILLFRVAKADNLLVILKEEGISPDTVFKWRLANPDFAARWNAARIVSAELMEAKAVEAAETATNENYQGHRLRMLAYQWSATKRHPKVYNDKTIVVGDSDNPVVFEHVHSLRQELIKRLGAMAIPEPLIIEHKPE